MHAPLRLSARHALHAMHAAFVPAPPSACEFGTKHRQWARVFFFFTFFTFFLPFFGQSDIWAQTRRQNPSAGGGREHPRTRNRKKKVVSRAKNGKKRRKKEKSILVAERREWGAGHRSVVNAPGPTTRVMTSLNPACDVPVSAGVAEMGSNRQPAASPALCRNAAVSQPLYGDGGEAHTSYTCRADPRQRCWPRRRQRLLGSPAACRPPPRRPSGAASAAASAPPPGAPR